MSQKMFKESDILSA